MKNEVNQVIASYYGFKGIPAGQLLFFSLFAGLLSPIYLFDKLAYFIVLPITCLVWLYATGDKPFEILERVFSPKTWDYYSPKVEVTKAGIPQMTPPLKPFYLRAGRKVHFVEDVHKEFKTFFDFEDAPIPVGCYVLKRRSEVKFRFGWEVQGHNAHAPLQQMEAIVERRWQALNHAPVNVSFRIEESSFLDDGGVLNHIESISENPGLTLIEGALFRSEKNRVEAMQNTESIERQPFGNIQGQKTFVFATVKIAFNQTIQSKPTHLDRLVSWASSIAGVGITEPDVRHWNNLKDQAYDGFLECDRIIRSSDAFGFKAKALSKDDLWRNDYTEFRTDDDVPDCPQWVPVTKDGIQLPEFRSDNHILGVLNTPDYGYPPIIQAERSYVYMPTIGKYAKFIRIGSGKKIQRFPEIDGSKEKGLYLFLHNILASKGDRFYDYKVIWEYYPDNTDIERINAERTLKGTLADSAHAMSRKTRNIQAETMHDEAAEALREMNSGNRVAHMTVGIWVFRDSVEEVTAATNNLLLRMSAANPEVALNCCEDLWNQSKRFEWSQMDTRPTDRRTTYLASEAAVVMPSISPQKLDEKGVWFLDERFRSPVWFDLLFKAPNNFAMVAEVGGSKSTVLFSIIMQGLAYRFPLILFEFPRPDGSSTFSTAFELMRLMGKKIANIDVRSKTINCLERVSLKHIKDAIAVQYDKLSRCAIEDREEILVKIALLEAKLKGAIEDTQANHLEIITAFVLGHTPAQNTADIVAAMLQDAYVAFINDPFISENYDVAVEAGFGNPGYERMPTLVHFALFARQFFQDKIENDTTLYKASREAIDLILISLNDGSLSSPLGRSIGGASSFEIHSADVVVLSLTNVSADKASLVYASIGMLLVAQKSILSEKSLFLCEEALVLSSMVPWAKRIATEPPKLRKQGTVFGALFQSISPLFATAYGQQLFANLQKIFILKLNSVTVKEVVKYLDFPEHIAKQYIGQTIDKETLTSRLCVMEGDKVIPLLHCPSEVHVAVTATNLDEVAARERCQAKYGNPNDLTDIQWLIIFSRLYSDAIRSGSPMSSICPIGSGWDEIAERDLVLS